MDGLDGFSMISANDFVWLLSELERECNGENNAVVRH